MKDLEKTSYEMSAQYMRGSAQMANQMAMYSINTGRPHDVYPISGDETTKVRAGIV